MMVMEMVIQTLGWMEMEMVIQTLGWMNDGDGDGNSDIGMDE